MGSARYKTSSDGCFRLYVQQTGISGNNAVLSAWIAVKNSAYIPVDALNNPKITIGGTTRTGSSVSVSGATDWKTVYSVSGITYAYSAGATGGSVSVSASGSLHFVQTEESDAYWASESVSAYYDLDTRTISGSLTATNAALNAKPTFTIGSYNSAYTYGISYSIGNASGTVATGISASTYNGWTVPAALGAQIPAGYTGTITYTLTTYSGTNAVGTATTTASITVPSYSYTVAAPTASKATYSTIGAYVAGKTKVDFAVPAPPAASYGATYTYTATITQGSSTLASQAFTAAGTISATPTGTGTVTCTVTMTDSRGATKSNSASVTYVANTLPTVTLSAYRVGSSGSTTQDITGAYYYATASGTYNALTNNTCTLTLTTTSTGTASGSSGKVSKTASGSLATTNTLTVTAKVQDALGNVATATAIIPQGFAVIQMGTGSDHKGVSIGKVGQVASAGKLEVGYDADFDGDLRVRNAHIPAGSISRELSLAENWEHGHYSTSGGKQEYDGRIRFKYLIPIDPGQKYAWTFSTTLSGKKFAFRVLDASGTLLQSITAKSADFTWSGDASGYFLGLFLYENVTVDDIASGSIKIGFALPSSGGGGGTGTITGVSVNGTSVATSGVADITDIPAEIVNGEVARATHATSAENVNAISTNSADTNGRWTVSIPGITELTDGLTIKIRLTKSYNSTFNTLNVNGLGEKLVWYRSNSRLTSHIPQYGVIALTYYGGNSMGSSYAVSNAYASDYTDKGAWAASTAYAVGDKVTNGSTSYICKTAHTSASSFATTNWNTLTSPSSALAKAKSATTAVTDGWFLEYQYQDGNDVNYQHRGSEIYQKSINNNMGRYQIVLTNRNGEIFPINSTNNSTSTSKTTFTTAEFDPLAKILYYNSTTEYTTNQNWSAGGNFYDQYNNVDLRYSFNISSSVNKLTTYLPVYLVATPHSNGQFKLYYGANGTTYSACLTQTLPSTEDGLVYIMLGMARSTYQINMWLNKPMYWFKNGAVREYVAVVSSSAQTIVATPLTAAAISASNSSAICTLTNRSYTLNNTEVYINVQCVLSSGVSLAGNDWWRLVRDFPMPKGATASTSDMGVSLNAVLYQSNGDYAGQVDAHIAYHSAETNRPAGWYLRVHTNVQLTAGMKVIASGSYLI